MITMDITEQDLTEWQPSVLLVPKKTAFPASAMMIEL